MSTIAHPSLQTYLDRLAENPDWQALSEEIEADAEALMTRLVGLDPGTPAHEVEALRGEIRGVLRLVEAPSVARRVIKERRER